MEWRPLFFGKNISLKRTAKALKYGGWEIPFVFEARPVFRGELLVSGRVYTSWSFINPWKFDEWMNILKVMLEVKPVFAFTHGKLLGYLCETSGV